MISVNTKNKWQYSNIVLKDHININLSHLRDSINVSTHESRFPLCLKYADITPIFQKENEIDNANYRPTYFICSISKILKNVIYAKIEIFK